MPALVAIASDIEPHQMPPFLVYQRLEPLTQGEA